MDIKATLIFPVIRGLQARREYYVAMWTLRMLRQIAIFDEDDMPLGTARPAHHHPGTHPGGRPVS